MYPDAVKCLQRGFQAVTAYLAFRQLEWMHLRTTNLIEQLHEEFKRRTKPMEIVAGEASVYRILAFVAMKMEMSWRNAPSGTQAFESSSPLPDISRAKVDGTVFADIIRLVSAGGVPPGGMDGRLLPVGCGLLSPVKGRRTHHGGSAPGA